MRWVAERENVPVIELNPMTKTLYEALGVEKSKKAFVHYPANTFPARRKLLPTTPTSTLTELPRWLNACSPA